jgi:tRNA(adenine34) deaminase
VDYKSLMQQAITLAKEAAVKGDVPVGALVVDDFGNVVGQGANLRQQDNDPTAHAEIVAIRDAAKKIGKYRLDGCNT